MQFLKKGSSDFFAFHHHKLKKAQTSKPYIWFWWVRSKVLKYFGGGVCFIKYALFFGGGGVQGLIYILTSAMIVHLISTMSVVWRKGPREKRRPKSGRTLVTHGRISGPFWFSTIFCKISVFEHTPPLKKINIFDRTHWSRILGFKIGAPQGSNWLKTKKSDGPFWRKSWEDFQKIKGSISKKGLIRFFWFSSLNAQGGPKFIA